MRSPDLSIGHPQLHRLNNSHRLWFNADACGPLRPVAAHSNTRCNACAKTCPVEAIQIDRDRIELTAQCVDCGRCAVACPSGALIAPDYQTLPATAQTLECQRVAPALAGDAHRLPCLGGLGWIALLEAVVDLQGSPLLLIDRHWCHDCPTGQQAPAALEAVTKVRRLLQAMQVPETWWPRIESLPTPTPKVQKPIREAIPENLGRRKLFNRVTRKIQDTLTETTPQPVTTTRQALGVAPTAIYQGQRLTRTLEQLATKFGVWPPGDLFPELTLDTESCALHGVCAAVCPSGALALKHSESNLALTFSAAHCIACGLCESQCPSGALKLLPTGNRVTEVKATPRVLHDAAQSTCKNCGKLFSRKGLEGNSSTVCGTCTHTGTMAAQLFGASFADSSAAREPLIKFSDP